MVPFRLSPALLRWAALEGMMLGGLFGLGYGFTILTLTVLTFGAISIRSPAPDSSMPGILLVVTFGVPVVGLGGIGGALFGLCCGALLGLVLGVSPPTRPPHTRVYGQTIGVTVLIALGVLWWTDGWTEAFWLLPCGLMLVAAWTFTRRLLKQFPVSVPG